MTGGMDTAWAVGSAVVVEGVQGSSGGAGWWQESICTLGVHGLAKFPTMANSRYEE